MPSLQIDFGACFLLALGLLVLPLDWLFGAILAAAFHEFCHFLSAKLLGIRCLAVRIGAGGVRMEQSPMGRWEELIVASSGPAGSLLLLMLYRIYPQLAVCAGVQGVFNLLPIWPLDGGRILASLLYGRERICRIVEWITAACILGAGIILVPKLGLWPLLLAVFATGKAFLRKIPCKEAILGVQ